MAVNPFTVDISIHKRLGVEPNTDNNLSADEVKALFDMPAEEIVKYINDTIVPVLDNLTPGMSLIFLISADKPRFSPALWLDISGQEDATKGVLKYIDSSGTIFPFSPIVKAESVDGLIQMVSAAEKTYVGTIGTNWTGTEPPFTQTISVPKMLESDEPIIDMTPSDTYETAMEQMEAYNCIYRIRTSNGFITVYSTEKTTTPVPIRMKVYRPDRVDFSSGGIYDANLTPGPGPISASVNGADHSMSNMELGAAPSSPAKYSFEIL